MNVVSLGDDVRTVRSTIGMEASDFHMAWRSLNVNSVLIAPISLT